MNHDTILRIDELERLWPVMRDKLQTYDAIIKQMENLECKADLHEKNSNHDHQLLHEKIDSNIKKSEEFFLKLESFHSNMQANISKIEHAVEKNGQEIKHLESSTNGLSSRLDTTNIDQKSYAKLVDIENLKNTLQEYKKEFDEKFDLSFTHTKELYNDFLKISEKITKDALESVTEKINSSNQERNNMKKDLEKLIDSISILSEAQVTWFQEVKNKFNQMVEDKINAIPKPVIPSLDEAKAYMQQQLEPVSLDARNAGLRSINTDTKFHVLEKKVEQLKLILDKLNLGS